MSVELLNGDCLALLPAIPAASIDLVCADLPYGTTACRWDQIIPLEPLWAEYRRVLKPRGAVVLTASQPFTTDLIQSNRKWFRFDDVWDKIGTTGFLDAKRRPLRRHESILLFAPSGRYTYNPQMTTGRLRRKGGTTDKPDQVYRPHAIAARLSDQYYPTSVLPISNAVKVGKTHPTQKPVALMEYLIRSYSNEGDTVLDNACGSATTLIACLNTGRHGIGMERDAEIYATAKARLAAAQAEHAERLALA